MLAEVMKSTARRVAVLLGCVLVLGGGTLLAGEWPQWRGADWQGVSDETGLVSSWTPGGENQIWHAEFIGRSTPVVLDGQACVIGRVGDGIDMQEVVACFDAADGKLRWEHKYNVYLTTVPYNRVGWASLAADKETGNIYAHGVGGQLTCYDRDGKILWSHFTPEEYGRLSGYGGRTQTPMVEGDQLIINFVSTSWGTTAALRHRYYAFDKKTGRLIWVSTPGKMAKDFNTQSAAVVADVKGRRTLVSGNADGWIYALDAATGTKLWEFQLSKRGLNSTVMVHGDRVFASHSEENLDSATMGRVVAIDATGSGNVTKSHELWRINELSVGFPSSAYHDGKLYVINNSGNMHCLDATDGKLLWEYSLGTVGKGSPVIADGKIYVTETNGRVHILELGDEGVKPLDMDELSVADGRYAEIYGSPAIAYGRVYFTTEGGVYCLGDKSKKIEIPRAVKVSKPKPANGAVVTLLVVPPIVTLKPGESIQLEARLFDAAGKPVVASKIDWELQGFKGTLSADGRLTAAPDTAFQTGKVMAKSGEASGVAGVRSIRNLPWTEDFESYGLEKSPPHWVGAGRKYVVREVDGNKVLVKFPRARGLNRTFLYMGPSDLSNYTIESDIWGGPHRRRRPDVGVIAGGYILDLQGAHQKLEIRSWTAELRMAQSIDFPWEMDTWYRMKLRVDTGADKAIVRGKVWKRGEEEPADWTLTVEDPHPIPGGSPGLLGYSPVDIYYDNIEVTVNK